MTDVTDDPYEEPTPLPPTEIHSERPRLSFRHRKAIRDTADNMIEAGQPNADGKRYIRIARQVTVIHYGGESFMCLTCSGHDRYQREGHKGCCHIERVQRWIAENESFASPPIPG